MCILDGGSNDGELSEVDAVVSTLDDMDNDDELVETESRDCCCDIDEGAAYPGTFTSFKD